MHLVGNVLRLSLILLCAALWIPATELPAQRPAPGSDRLGAEVVTLLETARSEYFEGVGPDGSTRAARELDEARILAERAWTVSRERVATDPRWSPVAERSEALVRAIVARAPRDSIEGLADAASQAAATLDRGPVIPTEPIPAARSRLAEARSAIDAGDEAAAATAVDAAYLHFERAENGIKASDPELAEEIEGSLDALRLAVSRDDPRAARRVLAALDPLLERAASAPAGEPLAPWAAFGQSFGILFREGIEALLLCAALAAACAKRGTPGAGRAIWGGAGLAIAASLGTAFVVNRLLADVPASREALEGFTMLLAAAVLFYVSYWLLSKLQVARWMGYLRSQLGRAETRWALAGVAFLAVYREGVETVLFYQALGGIGQPAPIWGGIAVGALVLTAIGVAIVRFGLRLPMRPLFAVTGGLLYYLAVVFAGQGMHELQEAGWMSVTAIDGVPSIGWLGIHPTLETLLAQGLLLALAALAGIVVWRRARRPPSSAADDRSAGESRPATPRATPEEERVPVA